MNDVTVSAVPIQRFVTKKKTCRIPISCRHVLPVFVLFCFVLFFVFFAIVKMNLCCYYPKVGYKTTPTSHRRERKIKGQIHSFQC